MTTFSRFAIIIVAGLVSVSCASRITSNRYARWSEQDRTRRIESEREEKIRAEVERRMGKETPAASSSPSIPALKAPTVSPVSPQPAATPEPSEPVSTPEPAAAPDPTPSIPAPPVVKEAAKVVKTATASRAVKPIFREMQEEEEAIY